MKCFMIVLVLCPVIALGQTREPASKGLRFHPILQMGVIHGKKENAFIAETIFGIQKHSFSAGIGAAIDNYSLRSLTVFLDIRKEFGKSADHFFIYGDGGVNMGLLRNKDKENFGLEVRNTSAGLYTAFGLGYKLSLPGKQAVAFSAGYSRKEIKLLMLDDRSWVTEYENIATFKYLFHRLDMKLGWIF